MELWYKIDELPTVSEALNSTYDEYSKHAKGFLEYKEYCVDKILNSFEKLQQWCEHLHCINEGDPCIPLTKSSYLKQNVTFMRKIPQQALAASILPVETSKLTQLDGLNPIYSYMQSVGYQSNATTGFAVNAYTNCYDDYLCDSPTLARANHYALGIISLFLCIFGIVGNSVIFPAYNVGLNRSGTTVYLSAIALFDVGFLVGTLLVFVSRYLPDNYVDQVVTYGTFSGRFIPIGLPLMHFCELSVVWLVVALLVNRLFYLKLGPQSKSLCSPLQSLKAIIFLVLLTLIYSSSKLLAYTSVFHRHPDSRSTIVLVLSTPTGGTQLYRNLMQHWLKVPLDMFLPYLSVGLLISAVVKRMVNLNSSKWRAVASLCTHTACACVCRYGVCGKECRDAVARPNTETFHGVHEKKVSDQRLLPSVVVNQPLEVEEFLPDLLFHQPQLDETRENANVVAAVCIGFLLILCKVPKLILHILVTENYVTYDPNIFHLVNQFLDTLFSTCKPIVCILVGAHFRQVLATCRCNQKLPGEAEKPTSAGIEMQLQHQPIAHGAAVAVNQTRV